MATKISNFLVKTVVFFAVLGVIFLLTMYNAKLLSTLNWFKTSKPILDRVIIIISSVAYSLGSIAVVIWYNPNKKETEKNSFFILKYIGATALKLLFVIIDGVHVYVYNNTHIEDLATWLSPVYALQTALILFFVGSIVNDIIKNGKEKQENDNGKFLALQSELELKESNINELESKIDNLQTNIEDYKTDIEDKKSIITKNNDNVNNLKSIIFELKNDKSKLESNLKVKQDTIEKYYPYFLKLQVSRIRKKNEKNRTEEDWEILQKFEELNIKDNLKKQHND